MTRLNYIKESPNLNIEKEIRLPLSKSIANRLLLIAAIGGQQDPLADYADDELCDDLRLMRRALFDGGDIIHVGDSGTGMRFLTAYFASLDGVNVELSLSERLSRRPVAQLIDALENLGANTVMKSGQSIVIHGEKMRGGSTQIDASASSQFISALMLVAPGFDKGVDLELLGDIVSAPYIGMTARLMCACGVDVEVSRDFRRISVSPGRYTDSSPLLLEPDWSAAAFFYEYVALSGKSIILRDLRWGSLQGDSRVADIFRPLGVQTTYTDMGVRLTPIKRLTDSFEANLRDVPDLYPALKVTLSLLKIPHTLTGLETLTHKESDRLAAVDNGLHQLEYEEKPYIDTCNDHRIVMAFSTARASGYELTLSDVAPVRKSYPGFPLL